MLPSSPPPSPLRPFFIAPVVVFLLVAAVLGAVLSFLTPPFQVADEPAHFYRAYQVSEGQLVATRIPVGDAGGQLPRSIVRVSQEVSDGVGGHPQVRQDRQRLREAMHTALAPQDTQEWRFAASAVYFPLVYFPQSLGMAPARLLEASPVGVLWAGRLGNVLVALVLTALALRLMPFQRWAFALLALTPMVLFQRASVSADPITLSACLLLLALSLHYTFAHPGPLGVKQLGLLLASAVFVALCKQAYLPLTLVFLLLPLTRLGTRGRYALALAAIVVVPALFQFAWSSTVRDIFRPSEVVAQVAHVKAHPFQVLGVLVSDLWTRLPGFLHQAGGVLGWLDTPVPASALLGLAALLFGVMALDGDAGAPKVGWRVRVVALGVAVAGVLAIQAMLYLAWTAPGAQHVDGVQGRYLLPYAPLLVVALAPPAWAPRALARFKPVLITGFIVLTAVVTLTTVYQRYYGPA
ncbi:DUF2142 domain-containing protein [Corallococcus aberystwythensis]|uniref:DUF2142 domain-containing protein n=1 Tax=Corallococcus aberystwythensis TaxID=2316722 RepID=A0A3A8QZN9_9BACT|nr:DUF2142 domain-containing protein [Corallococcus aberystwythensis]RKH68604.1 DUF2142 domain-containing protein [Corallococcus aberystwythensis]